MSVAGRFHLSSSDISEDLSDHTSTTASQRRLPAIQPLPSTSHNNTHQSRDVGLLSSSSATPYRQAVDQQQPQHVSINTSQQRPRTTFFQNGFPQRLPPTPVTTFVANSFPEPEEREDHDSQSFSAAAFLPQLSSYLNMIKNKNDTVAGIPQPAPIPISKPVRTNDTPAMDWLTDSPIPGTDTSLQSFLESPLFDSSPLFGDAGDSFDVEDTPLMPTPPLDPLESEGLFTMGPDIYTSPALLDYNSFEATSGVGVADLPLMGLPSNVMFPPSKDNGGGFNWSFNDAPSAIAPSAMHNARPQPHPVQRKTEADTSDQSEASQSKKQWNGTRPNVTPSKLIPVDAPVQTRSYVTPSATSRKEVPAAFANRVKKRSAAAAFGVEAEMTEEEVQRQIEAKRLQNTKAARRSRARKLEYQQTLENDNTRLREENEALKKRCEELERLVQ